MPAWWMSLADPDTPERIIAPGRASVGAIEALSAIEPTGPIKQALTVLVVAGSKRWLRAIIEAAPSCVREEILSAGERIGRDRAVS